MSSEIKVSDVAVSNDGLVSCEVAYDQTAETLWFQLPDSHRPHHDLLATAVAATFGNRFDKWSFDAPISTLAKQRLEFATQATWEVPRHTVTAFSPGPAIILSFSGGFDSLASLCAFGRHARLVSVDFGPRFQREVDFFTSFDTAVVKTNCREFESQWTFMGVGALLMADYFSAGGISFGSIFESTPYNLNRQLPLSAHPIFDAVDLSLVNAVGGITEFGTALMVLTKYPDRALDALVSLADPHTEKYLRKTIILRAAAERMGISLDFDSVKAPTLKEPATYGSSYAPDFLAPLIWRLDPERGDKWMSITKGYERWAKDMDLDFYWRLLPYPVPTLRDAVAREIDAAFRASNILSFRGQDWDDFRRVVELVKFFHVTPLPTW